jgi:hypothetical protein
METMKRMSCDFYSREQWDAAAVQMAEMMQKHVFDRHFGVSPWVVENYFVFFGNEGPCYVSAMLATVRQEIEMMDGMVEVGVGVTTDGYSWALIVRVDGLLADGTDDVCEFMQRAIVRAWNISRGFFADAPGID